MIKHISCFCPMCGARSVINIPVEAYEAWQMGISIQEAWSEGSPSERETLISGLCSDCQKEVFNEEDVYVNGN